MCFLFGVCVMLNLYFSDHETLLFVALLKLTHSHTCTPTQEEHNTRATFEDMLPVFVLSLLLKDCNCFILDVSQDVAAVLEEISVTNKSLRSNLGNRINCRKCELSYRK